MNKNIFERNRIPCKEKDCLQTQKVKICRVSTSEVISHNFSADAVFCCLDLLISDFLKITTCQQKPWRRAYLVNVNLCSS